MVTRLCNAYLGKTRVWVRADLDFFLSEFNEKTLYQGGSIINQKHTFGYTA